MIIRELRPDEYDLLNESGLYKDPGALTKDRSKWKEKATEAEIYNDDEDIHDPCLRFQR